MRSVKKTAGAKKSSMSGAQQVQVIKTGLDVVKSGINLYAEMEKTRQIAINAQAQMHMSDNELKMALAKYEREMFEIEKNYQVKMKELENQQEIKKLELEIIKDIINQTKNMEVTINIYVDSEGLMSDLVMRLRADMHSERVKLIEMATQIKSD